MKHTWRIPDSGKKVVKEAELMLTSLDIVPTPTCTWCPGKGILTLRIGEEMSLIREERIPCIMKGLNKGAEEIMSDMVPLGCAAWFENGQVNNIKNISGV